MSQFVITTFDDSLVNREQAETLNKLGFNLDCPDFIAVSPSKSYYAPKIKVALEWLRKQNYFIEVIYSDIVQQYGFKISNPDGKLLSDCYWYNDYQSALSSALSKCFDLKNNINQ